MLIAARATATLLKLPIGLAIALSAMAGMVAADGAFDPVRASVFTLAVLGASGAAGGFNHYHERARDRLMRRTRGRPFASGALKAGAVWPVTFLGLLVASIAMGAATGGPLAAVFVFLGAFTYAVVYTVWLKPRSAWNIVIGGAAGSFAVLAGAAAVGTAHHPVPVILAVVMFLWTPPHFWSLAAAKGDDYRQAGVPMLPVVAPAPVWTGAILAHAVALAVLSLLPLAHGMGPAYGAFAAAGGALFVWRSWQLCRRPDPKSAMKNFAASLIQFSLLATGVFLDAAVRWSL